MGNIDTNRGASKAERTPFLKFYTGDWLAGTLGMSFEEKGFYLELLIRMWDRKSALPNSDAWLSTSLQCNPRTVRKLRASLVSAGKLEISDGCLSNSRMMQEIETHRLRSNSKRIRPEFDLNSSRIRAEFEANKPENEAKSTERAATQNAPIFQKPESRSKKESTAAASNLEPARPSEPAAALPPKVNLDGLSDRLIEACNGSLDNPANCMGLLNLSTPQMWINQGCDLEADILPTLRAAGQKYHGKRIRDWSYFTGMIAEAKAKRTTALPEVSVSSVPRAPPPNSRLARTLEFRALLNVSKPEQVTP